MSDYSSHGGREAQSFKGKHVLVLGLGKFGGGVGVTQYLVKEGARIRVSDSATREELSHSIDQLKDCDIEYRFGPHLPEILDGIDCVVVNPAFAPHNPFIAEIAKRGIPQTTEVNIFFERCKGTIIGVIGTNGKETIVRLADALLSKLGKKVVVGGNIGASLLDLLDTITSDTLVLFELSSFQLHRLQWITRRPGIAVYCNITPDHLEWHGTLEKYISDKCVALRGQGERGVTILNVDDPILRRVSDHDVEGICIRTSTHTTHADIYVEHGKIVGNTDGKISDLSPTDLKIVGEHNLSNAVLAAAIGFYFGADASIIGPTLTSFRGVPYALEYVDTVEGIQFYNDSAATNPEATYAALASFPTSIYLIVGGYDKHIEWTGITTAIAQKVKGVATIGQLTDTFADAIHSTNPSLPLDRSHTLKKAFAWCTRHAHGGDIVVLSPATSSYDQYRNLEQRGDEFKRHVAHYAQSMESHHES